MFITESWFWRGTQSAIFYYVSCSPCIESKYKQSRRKEAQRAEKERAEIIMKQPGIIMQPGPFQTNPDWAEEIIMGPGPPKGWKKDKLLHGYSESARERYRNETRTHQLPAIDVINIDAHQIAHLDGQMSDEVPSVAGVPRIAMAPIITNEAGLILSKSRSAAEPASPTSEITSDTILSSSSSDSVEQVNKTRPSMDRRLSTAVENLKDTIKGWNLKRYDREDEILSGLNERLRGIWDKATSYGEQMGGDKRKMPFVYGRKRAGTAGTTDSEHHDWQRAVRNPEINELHPPTASKLPTTRDEAAWMLLPPPSAAVMAARSRPLQESPVRWPLSVIGREQSDLERLRHPKDVVESRPSYSANSITESRKTPDLSNSSSDESWIDEEEESDNEKFIGYLKRHSVHVAEWVPLKPPQGDPVHPPLPVAVRHLRRNENPGLQYSWA